MKFLDSLCKILNLNFDVSMMQKNNKLMYFCHLLLLTGTKRALGKTKVIDLQKKNSFEKYFWNYL